MLRGDRGEMVIGLSTPVLLDNPNLFSYPLCYQMKHCPRAGSQAARQPPLSMDKQTCCVVGPAHHPADPAGRGWENKQGVQGRAHLSLNLGAVASFIALLRAS